MKNLRNYLIVLPTLLLLLVLFKWYQSNQSSNALMLDPVFLSETVSSQEEVASEVDSEAEEAVGTQMIYVDLKGAIRYPNVYAIPLGSRLFDVIEMAGGLLPDAATQHLNQSLLLSDQSLIYIYSLEEVAAYQIEEVDLSERPLIIQAQPSETDELSNGLVNINQATLVELMTLPGIGPKKAEAILQYRSEHGSFASPEALMEVSGIGQKTYEQLATLIMVD